MKNRIQNIVFGKRVAVYLVWSQFGGGWFFNGVDGDDDSILVHVTGEGEYFGFRDVRNYGKTSAHVAVKGTVSDGKLALVSSR